MGVSVRRKPRTDKYYIHIRRGDLRIAFKYDSEEEANEVAKEFRKQISLGLLDVAALKKQREREETTAVEPAVQTVQEYYDKTFLPLYVETAVAKSTAASYRKNFSTHILPTLGGRRLNDVDQEQMEEFVSALVKKRPQTKKKKDVIEVSSKKPNLTLAKATIDTVIKQLRKFFNHARRRKIIADNPASGLTQLYSQARTAHEVIEPLTREDVPLFLAEVKRHDDAFVTITREDGTKAKRKVTQHYPLFFMAIHTGLRAGELAGLQRGDIDFHGKYVVVQRSIDRAHRKVVPTKSKRIRRVDLSDELIIVLKEHLRQQKEWWFAEGKPQPEWLFPNTEGEWSDMRNIADRHFDKCLEKAGLHHRRFHDLRHTFASLMLTNGAPIAYVSEQMGHASIQLTVKLYGHLQPGANRHWMNSLPTLNSPSALKAATGDK